MGNVLKGLSWLLMIIGLMVIITLVSFIPTGTADPMGYGPDVEQPVVASTPYWDNVKTYLTGLVKGDLGETELGEPVSEVMLTFAPRSLAILFGAFILAVPVGIAGGVFFAMRKGRLWDKMKSLVTYASMSFPDFFVVFFMQWLAIKVWQSGWEVIPAAGYRSPEHMILPIVTLSLLPMLFLLRLTWHSVDEVMQREPYITTARSKGIERLRVYLRHALGNVWVRLLDHIPQLFVLMVSNLLIIEFLFYYPGAVFQLFARMAESDQVTGGIGGETGGPLWDPSLMATTAILFALCFLMLYAISRGLRLWIDPRLREQDPGKVRNVRKPGKNKMSKQWKWGIAGAVIVLFIVAATVWTQVTSETSKSHEAMGENGTNGDTHKAGEDDEERESHSEDSEPIEGINPTDVFQLGEAWVVPGEWTFFAEKVVDGPPSEVELEPPANGMKYVSVQITLENNGDSGRLMYDPYRINMFTSEGLVSPSDFTDVESEAWNKKDLDRNGKVTTINTYEVPQEDTSLTLIFQPSFYQDKLIAVEIQLDEEKSR